MDKYCHLSTNPILRIWLYALTIIISALLFFALIIFPVPELFLSLLMLIPVSLPAFLMCQVCFEILKKSRLPYYKFLSLLFLVFAIIIMLNVFLTGLALDWIFSSKLLFQDNLNMVLAVSTFPIIATYASMFCSLSDIRADYPY